MAKELTDNHSYSDKLTQLIPAEIIGAYVAIQQAVVDGGGFEHKDWVLPVSGAILLLILPLYLYKIHLIRSAVQVMLSMISFVVWFVCLGGMYIDVIANVIDPILRSVILVLWTAIVPVLMPKQT